MGLNSRRLLAGPLLALAAAGAGLVVAPVAAQAAGVSATVEVRTTLKLRSGPSLASRWSGRCATAEGHRGVQRRRPVGAGLGPHHESLGPAQHRRLRDRRVPLVQREDPAVRDLVAAGVAGEDETGGHRHLQDRHGTQHRRQVNIRTGPSTSYPVKRSVANGAKVQGVCGVVGSLVNGTVRSTTQWNRLSDGAYISHAYVVTPTLHICPGTPATPVTTPSMTPAQFIAAAVPGAQRGWREYGVPASVTIAQAILESGWGRSGLSVTDRNYFGIKCQNGAYGNLANGCHVYNTSECDKAGNCFATTASFRTYGSMANSFRDHGNFLRVNSRYKPAFGYTKDANKFIWTVWKAGYATDPNYFTKVTTLMAQNKLYQYDIWK